MVNWKNMLGDKKQVLYKIFINGTKIYITVLV